MVQVSQRQRRMGEKIRHALAASFTRNDHFIGGLDTKLVTVSEVIPSPDMRHAKVFVTHLAGADIKEVLKLLNDHAGQFNKLIAPEMTSKYTPRLKFYRDDSFDEAARIEDLLNKTRS